MSRLQRFSTAMFALWAVLTIGEIWWRLTGDQPLPVLGLYAAVPLWLFGVSHLVATKGALDGLLFAGIALFLGGGLELVGLNSGIDQYSDLLGPKIGPLPVMIPFAWLGSLYPAYLVVNLLAEQATSGRVRQRFGWMAGIGWALILALATAVGGTTYDLGLDPPMVAAKVWTYKIPGPYYNVPFANFAGWLTIITLVVLPIRLRELARPPEPPRGWFALLPLAVFGGSMAAALVDNLIMDLPVPAMVMLLSQGAFLMAALSQVISRRLSSPSQTAGADAA